MYKDVCAESDTIILFSFIHPKPCLTVGYVLLSICRSTRNSSPKWLAVMTSASGPCSWSPLSTSGTSYVLPCLQSSTHLLAKKWSSSSLWWPVAPPSGIAHAQKQSGEAHTMDLAHEWFNFRHNVLYQRVINKIQSARVSPTRSLYGRKWRIFEELCARTQDIPFQRSLGALRHFDRT